MRGLISILFLLGSSVALPIAIPGIIGRGLSSDVAHLEVAPESDATMVEYGLL
ncbi:hypothetical protein N431DRAFT_439054, partial [Stipitochalara longipes BDJ]